MRKTYRLALPAVAVLALAGLSTPADAATRVVLDQGHVDVIGIAFVNGAFNVHVHDAAHAVEYAPSQVQLVAKPGSKITVPDDPSYQFLGAAGAPAWVLPQVQDPALLWPGIGSEEIAPGVFANNALNVDIVGLTGPGDLDIYTTDPFGSPTVLVDSTDGLPDRINHTAGGHLHANWAFEAPGYYEIRVKVSGKLASTGQTVTSNTVSYSFKVGL